MISEDCFSCDRPTYLDNLSGNISLQGLHLLSAGPATTHKAPHAPQAFLKAFRQDGPPPGGALDTMRVPCKRKVGMWMNPPLGIQVPTEPLDISDVDHFTP